MLLTGTLLLAEAAATQPGPAVQRRPDFDPKDVVRQVRQMPDEKFLRPGLQEHRGISPTMTRPAQDSPTPDPGPPTPFFDEGEFTIDTSIAHVGAPGFEEYPALAFGGADFLVTWTGYRDGLCSDICSARISPAGVVFDRQNAGYRAELLDISCREVMELNSGPNDVSRLAPGVHFVRSADGSQRSAVSKVVIQR